MKDITIIGGGPSGMAAAIYALRAGLDTVVLEKFAPGGQILNTSEVENYPGFPEPVGGFELVDKMQEQATRLGAVFENVEVEKIEKIENVFHITTSESTIQSKAVIMCTGSKNKKLGISGEAEFIGKGVSYCGTCDGAFYRGKTVVAVGGGNTAVEEAIFLTKFADKVYLIHRRDKFRADNILVKRAMDNPKIEILLNAIPTKINGTEKVESVDITDVKTNKIFTVKTDGFFIFIGYEPVNNLTPKELLNDKGEIEVDISMKTKLAGFFAAGDIRSHSKKQILMACADGATAAMRAYEYINI